MKFIKETPSILQSTFASTSILLTVMAISFGYDGCMIWLNLILSILAIVVVVVTNRNIEENLGSHLLKFITLTLILTTCIINTGLISEGDGDGTIKIAQICSLIPVVIMLLTKSGE